VEGKVESVDGSVCYTLNDMAHVWSCSNVGIGSKTKGPVDKIICEGWDRVLCCQVNNCENVSYLLDLRWLPRVIVKHPPYRARVRKGNVANSSLSFPRSE